MKKYFLLLLSFLFCVSCRQAPTQEKLPQIPTQTTGALAKKAMVVSAHPLASQVGVEILKDGGNAIDAAIAVQFALAVVYPIAGNIGGGGFMVYRSKEGELNTLDFREKAPLSASKNMYLDSLEQVIPRLSLDGHLAVGVPGTVDGMVKMHEKYGSMPFKHLVQPAIDLAENGYAFVSERQSKNLNRFQEDFKKMNTTGHYFTKKNDWQLMDTLTQKDLAKTLTLIRDSGEAGFYEGTVADSIVAEMKRGNGMITHEDLKKYESVWREPVIGDYHDYRIISMGPPSSGGIALVQLCKMLEAYPLNQWKQHDPQTIHHVVEMERRVYADRATHLGDPDFYKVPINGLLNDAYLKQRRSDFDPKNATRTAQVRAGEPEGAVKTPSNPKESEQTTHFSIVDPFGNAVSITTTLNGAYGSKVSVGGCGFLLNNEMDDFSAKPGVPNMFGLVGNEANAIAPEKRMLSSMTPTIIEKEDNLFMVVGTPGGSTIITSVLQTFLNVVSFNMTMQEAVNTARYHHQWKPDTLYVEKAAFDKSLLVELQKMGHYVVERSSIGLVDAILVHPNGMLEGGADIRGDDTALGF